MDPSQLGPLESRRDALIGELSQNYSVHVVHRSDGTIRVRNKEGHVLLDSTEHAEGPALSGAEVPVASEGPATADPVVASAAYEKMLAMTGETSAPIVAAVESLETAIVRETSLEPVASVSTVQGRIEIVSQLEDSLNQSSNSLGQAMTQTESISSLL